VVRDKLSYLPCAIEEDLLLLLPPLLLPRIAKVAERAVLSAGAALGMKERTRLTIPCVVTNGSNAWQITGGIKVLVVLNCMLMPSRLNYLVKLLLPLLLVKRLLLKLKRC